MTRPAELPPMVPSRSPPVAAGESPAGYAAEDVRARLQKALGGAYTIEREIAGGGSSRVFAGMETALERHVAIKVLPPDLIAAINVERFHRETHLVANLQHPHIVPLLTAGTADGMLYYTMPLIDGESLRERIAREGVLAIPEVIRILLEIADALAYASSHGVVHRDVKPGNVLLSAGHALVTDFGIAKAVTSAAAAVKLTSAGIALGTPTYMAPEQGTADASTDHRADIYSLGAVGYEMLTGRPPFTGTVRQVLVAHATESPQPVTELREDVPEPLAALIMRCLEKEPTERPQTAAAVRDALDMMLTQKEVNGPPSLGMQAPRTRRFRSLVGAALSAAALGTAIGVQVYTERQELDPHRVIVAAFQNESGDPQLEQLGTMTTDWITRGLTETGLADPIPATPTRDASGQIVPGELELKSLARQARALGGRHIVAGAIYATGDSFQVHARIADAVDGKILVSVPPAVGSKVDPMLAINTMRTSVLGALAAMSPWEGFGVVSSDAPPSYAAYREFLRGEEAFSRGDFQAAIEHDRRAIALDSTYLAPLVRIAYAFINIGQCAQTDSVGRLVNAKRDQLPAYEGYYLDRVLAWCRGDLNAAYLAAKRMVAVAPHSSYAKYISARSALPINRPHEALDALERLDWRKPHISGYYTDLTGALHKLGKYERELEVARLYRERHSGSLLPAEAYVRALSALGRVEEVRRATAASLAMSSIEWVSGPATVSLTASRELAAHGHPDAGRRIAQELVEWLRQRDPTTEIDSLLVKALLSARQFAAAYSEARPLVAAHPENVRYLTFIGVSAAGMDDRVEAERVSDALGQLKQPNVGGATIYGQAAIAARLGERARAVTLLREAIRKGYTDALQDDADLNFLSLHGYPPYEELVKPRG